MVSILKRTGTLALVLSSSAIIVFGCSTVAEKERSPSRTSALGSGDVLYIGDTLNNIGDFSNDTVKRFDAHTGVFESTIVAAHANGLLGVRGIVIGKAGELIVANQNVNATISGEIFRYDAATGAFLGALVPHTDAHAPYAPRGIVRRGNTLFVADMGEPEYTLAGSPAPNPFPSRVAKYDVDTGAWLGDLTFGEFAQTCPTPGHCLQLSARAVVFGPDGALYVSGMEFDSAIDPRTAPGKVIRFPHGGAGPAASSLTEPIATAAVWRVPKA